MYLLYYIINIHIKIIIITIIFILNNLFIKVLEKIIHIKEKNFFIG